MASTRKRNLMARLNGMPKHERAAYLAAGKMRVEHIQQLDEAAHNFVTRWVARVRGFALRGDDGRFLFDTKEEARTAGLAAMERIRNDAREAQ